jgi:uncharacterized membrane protein YdbT with pleckstrin-like domain
MSGEPSNRPAESEPRPLRNRAYEQAGKGAGLDPADEKELWVGRASWKDSAPGLLCWAVFSIIIVVAGLWVRGQAEFFRGTWAGWVIVFLIVLPGAYVALTVLLRVYGVRYRLTTQRLIIDRGVLSRTTDQTELIRMDDVRVYKSLTERLFGIGSVEVVSTDSTDARIRLRGIETPDQVVEYIRSNMRTLHKQSLYMEQL